MASGGGGHPSHLPITMPASSGGSLQTPDTSALFMSSLGGSGGGGPGGSGLAPTPLDQSQSFTSLEELLNVTGINSLELGQEDGAGLKKGEGDGVGSLQQIAKEVESSQGSGTMEPPHKRPRLDTSAPSILPNIRIQPLYPSSSSSSSSPSFSTVPQASSLPGFHSNTPIASLLDKGNPTITANHLESKPPTSLPTSTPKLFPSNTAPSLQPSRATPPPPYGFNSSPGGESMLRTQPAGEVRTRPSSSQSQLNSFLTPQASQTAGVTPQKQPLTSGFLSSSSSSSSSSAQGQGVNIRTLSFTAPGGTGGQASGGNGSSSSGGGHTTATKLADSINSNSRSVVLQLMQLYKQYQALNDKQGMGRVRDQLNLLVSAQQKILAAQSSLSKAADAVGGSGLKLPAASSTSSNSSGSSEPSSNQLPHQARAVPEVGSAATGGSVGTPQSQQQQQQQRAQQLLGQLAAVAATGAKRAPSQASIQSNMRPAGGSFLSTSPSLSSITTTTTTTPPRTITVGSAWQGQGGGALSKVAPPPSYSQASMVVSGASTRTGGGGGGGGLSLPGEVGTQGAGTVLQSSGTSATNNVLGATQAGTQKAVKQIHMLLAALPDSKRPKNVQELKEFVQRYSTFFNKGLNSATPQSAAAVTAVSKPPTVSSSVASTSTNFSAGSSGAPRARVQSSVQLQSSVTDANAHVNQHFAASLSGLGSSSSSSSSSASSGAPIVPQAPGPSLTAQTGGGELVKRVPVSVSQLNPVVAGAGGSLAVSQGAQVSKHLPSAAPLPPSSSTSIQATPTTTSSSSSSSGGIQAGIATPLPPGLTLETLGVLCRLPDADLQKLKLPAPLMSAIKVWKARQGASSTKTKVSSSANNKNNIPVLIPPGGPGSASQSSSASSGGGLLNNSAAGGSMVTFTKSSGPQPHIPHGVIVKPMGTTGQPNVIPSGVGFPPRSLHAFIPAPAPSMTSLGVGPSRLQSSGTSTSQHMTRYKIKMEQQKIRNEKFQALQKALQSSEEARIAYRFSGHLEKMHTQLSNPDTLSAFRSQHDVLARLLPYHLYAESEPPPAAVEKADAVFESVAQVLLSRSRGLRSRFEQIVMKESVEGGPEARDMVMQLERLFMEGEQERIQKENMEKKEAEKIAANLSLMADQVGSFDSDFSFGDVFNPMMTLDSGVT